MAGVAGIAIRGAGKALLKGKVKPKPSYPKAKPRGTPTKAGLVARRAALRGETTAEKYTKLMPSTRQAVKDVSIGVKKTTRDIGKGAIIAGVAYAAGKAKAKKEAKAKDTKEKLQKSTEEHKKKTKEKREKYGKHHG